QEAHPLARNNGGYLAVEIARLLTVALLLQGRETEARSVGVPALQEAPEEDAAALAAVRRIEAEPAAVRGGRGGLRARSRAARRPPRGPARARGNRGAPRPGRTARGVRGGAPGGGGRRGRRPRARGGGRDLRADRRRRRERGDLGGGGGPRAARRYELVIRKPV